MAVVLRDPRVKYTEKASEWRFFCDEGPVVDTSREKWAEYADQPQERAWEIQWCILGLDNHTMYGWI